LPSSVANPLDAILKSSGSGFRADWAGVGKPAGRA
jgi:hypothetical protein